MTSLRRHLVLVLALLAACFCTAAAQTVSQTVTLSGTITDPSGAVIPNATVSLTTPDGHTVATVKSDSSGQYRIINLKPGLYIVIASAQDFATSESKAVNFAAGKSLLFNIKLQVAVAKQQVIVNENVPTVSVEPTNNASSLIIKGNALNALSDDPDELQNELNALAGPAAGPNGGQIYIDGFTGGQLPPKSAILEIRINRNPFSAEYDKLGYGRIEIITKPGTNQLHGQFFVLGNPSQFNTGNPFDKDIPSYYSYMFNGTISGRINKHASFFVSGQRRQIQDDAVVSAYRLAGEVNGDFDNGIYDNPADYDTVSFSDAVVTPRTRTNISPRVDLSLGAKNTLTIRYQYYNDGEQNQGVGQFNLADQAYQTSSSENTLQISETAILSNTVINDTRFEFRRDVSSQTPSTVTPQVQVSGLETFGGNADQFITDHTLYYELQNNTAIAAKSHSINFGGRLRVTRDANTSNANFNGTFTFGGNNCSSGQTGCTPTTAAENYGNTIYGVGTGQTWTEIQANGGGPSQLTLVYGNPKIVSSMADVGLYYQDDWGVRPNFTFSYGLRWESQSGIYDKSDWAPRFELSWGLARPGKQAKTVLRAGYGIFYDRFGLDQIMQADRLNDSAASPLNEVVVENPTCYYPNGFTYTEVKQGCEQPGSTSSKPAVYQIYPYLHAGVNEQVGASIERQVNKFSTVSVTYLYSLGQHQLVTRNANAPQVPGYDPAQPNIYQYYSEAVYKQNQIIANFNARVGQRVTFFGFYTAGWANSDTNGVSSNPSNSANLKLDYGRATFDVRNRMFLIGSFAAPWDMRFSPFIVAQSGAPFDITLGQDVNGDSFFNDRPSYAQPGDTDTISTQYGDFNLNPGTNYTPIPVNLGDGPALFTFNLRVSKSLAFGPKVAHGGFGGGGGHWHGHGLGPGGLNGGGGGSPFGPHKEVNHRYNMTLNVQALNLFNDINYAPPTGVLGSPEFGKSNALAGRIFSSGSASRRIFASLVFSF
ncbi:MAG TPA: carboxypeptidase regulatory-like domain-containing protein [Acidobacteriaceae bacterium]|nr:carboxypeptidase regulatory-like domain-containing protein [Acidobacteriaceae bacterium]